MHRKLWVFRAESGARAVMSGAAEARVSLYGTRPNMLNKKVTKK
jgi:hypothetical protein